MQIAEIVPWDGACNKAIEALMEETVRHVKARLPRIYSRELVELLFTQPYCRTGDVVGSGIASRNIAAKYLKELTAIDVVLQHKDGREVLYLNTRFLDLLKRNEQGFRPYPAS